MIKRRKLKAQTILLNVGKKENYENRKIFQKQSKNYETINAKKLNVI